MTRFYISTVSTAAFLTMLGLAQETPKEPTEFEAVSVKRLAQPSNIHVDRGGPGTTDPQRLTMQNQTLQGLISSAWHLRPEQISGPSWLDTERYDVIARVPPGITREQMRLMLQNLLTGRFQLVLHHETKDLRVYNLTVGKSGAKLTPSPLGTPSSGGNRIVDRRIRWTLTAYTMDQLAGWLSGVLQASVLNSTGLTGTYDMTFEYMPDPSGTDNPFAVPAETVLESQFGLRVQAERRRMDMLVIDRAKKQPADN